MKPIAEKHYILLCNGQGVGSGFHIRHFVFLYRRSTGLFFRVPSVIRCSSSRFQRASLPILLFRVIAGLWRSFARGFHPAVQFFLIETPDAPVFVGGDAAFAGELVERRLADFQMLRRFFKGQPRCHSVGFSCFDITGKQSIADGGSQSSVLSGFFRRPDRRRLHRRSLAAYGHLRLRRDRRAQHDHGAARRPARLAWAVNETNALVFLHKRARGILLAAG